MMELKQTKKVTTATSKILLNTENSIEKWFAKVGDNLNLEFLSSSIHKMLKH